MHCMATIMADVHTHIYILIPCQLGNSWGIKMIYPCYVGVIYPCCVGVIYLCSIGLIDFTAHSCLSTRSHCQGGRFKICLFYNILKIVLQKNVVAV